MNVAAFVSSESILFFHFKKQYLDARDRVFRNTGKGCRGYLFVTRFQCFEHIRRIPIRNFTCCVNVPVAP